MQLCNDRCHILILTQTYRHAKHANRHCPHPDKKSKKEDREPQHHRWVTAHWLVKRSRCKGLFLYDTTPGEQRPGLATTGQRALIARGSCQLIRSHGPSNDVLELSGFATTLASTVSLRRQCGLDRRQLNDPYIRINLMAYICVHLPGSSYNKSSEFNSTLFGDFRWHFVESPKLRLNERPLFSFWCGAKFLDSKHENYPEQFWREHLTEIRKGMEWLKGFYLPSRSQWVIPFTWGTRWRDVVDAELSPFFGSTCFLLLDFPMYLLLVYRSVDRIIPCADFALSLSILLWETVWRFLWSHLVFEAWVCSPK